MSGLLRRASQVVVLGCVAGAGWVVGHNTHTLHTPPSGQQHTPLTLPIFQTVKAAAIQGGSVVSTEPPHELPPPAPNAPHIGQIMRFGFPGLTNVRSLDDYVLSYDTRNRIPYWVCEHLTSASVTKNPNVDRSKCDFHEDLSVHEYFRAENSDYKRSGFDRGHMAAAGNHRLSQEDCKQTFLLSNMAPQVGRGFNRDKWNELESYCRKLVRENANVYICTGPLFLPRREEDGKLYVKYQVLGQNHVAVPTHFFKVVVCESKTGELSLESFLMPNIAIDDGTPLSTFHVPTDVVERASGLLFFDKIGKNKFKMINGGVSHWERLQSPGQSTQQFLLLHLSLWCISFTPVASQTTQLAYN
ncbi:hypothetical protein Pmani_011061 [Petrolisthes manimaculis]|uniref:Endonuclease n=1 Tax=Petrolisthes manimaculis TaxID=1843537 RepID=A0AAE1Q0E8_9EUCA|nr:hypothetical protein Pmani_011061 [Petrolisthes manimaculis]